MLPPPFSTYRSPKTYPHPYSSSSKSPSRGHRGGTLAHILSPESKSCLFHSKHPEIEMKHTGCYSCNCFHIPLLDVNFPLQQQHKHSIPLLHPQYRLTTHPYPSYPTHTSYPHTPFHAPKDDTSFQGLLAIVFQGDTVPKCYTTAPVLTKQVWKEKEYHQQRSHEERNVIA